MFFKYIIIFLLSLPLVAKNLTFAVLPMIDEIQTLKEYTPMLEFLSKKTKFKFDIYMPKDYNDLINKLRKNKIDLVFIDTLTYIKIQKELNYIKPLVTFKDFKGNTKATCSIITTFKDISSISDIKNKKFILTNKISMCGNIVTENMLNDANFTLKDLNYSFVGKETDLAMSIILQEYPVGILQTNIAKKYESMGVKILSTSSEMLGYLLLANNKNIAGNDIKNIKDILLALDLSKDYYILRRWGDNIKYGCTEVNEKDFQTIKEKFKIIKID